MFLNGCLLQYLKNNIYIAIEESIIIQKTIVARRITLKC